MSKVAVYGCKSIPERAALALLYQELGQLRPSQVWHGGTPRDGTPRGVSAAVLEWSARALVTPITTEASWQRYGTRCGEVRGRNVAKWCEAACVLWDPFAPEPEGTLAAIVREIVLLNADVREPRRRIRMVITAADWKLDRVLDTEAIDESFVLGALTRPRMRRPRSQAA